MLKKTGSSEVKKDMSELSKLIDEQFHNLDVEAIPGVVKARLSETKLSNKEIVDSVFTAVTKGSLDTIPSLVWQEYENFLNEHIEDSKYQVYIFQMPAIATEIQYLRTKRENEEKKGLKKVKANEKVVSIASKDFALDLGKKLSALSNKMKSDFKTETSSRLTVNGYQALKIKIINLAKATLDGTLNEYKVMLQRRIDKMF
jgi:hypothetical protein